MYDDNSSSDGGPKGSYEIYKSEGDVLFKQGSYKKALASYNTALELKPGNNKCLVARAKCYIQLGDSTAALADAEETLKENPKDIKGLYMKAESLYQCGNFEYALVNYHRGNKLRPELQEFRLGIQKAQEAIENSIGEGSKRQLTTEGDLTYFYEKEEKGKTKQKSGYNKPGQKKEEKKEQWRPKSSQNDKQIKHLLGELYADKEYLEKLLKETDDTSSCNQQTNEEIRDLVIQGLQYLDTRTEFWRQQKPTYSRKRDKKMREKAGSRQGGGKKDPTQYVLKKLEQIDELQAQGKHAESLKLGEKTLKDVEKWADEDVSNRPEMVANLHSLIGNAHLEMGNYSKALHHHNIDNEIATQQDLEEAKSRALDNLGRVYARMGKFDKAIEVWEEKVPMSKSPLESTWLYHEIGRCYLEQGKHQEARDYGEKSLNAAKEAEDDVWQLNASVLVAQAEVKLGDLQAALEAFEKSLEMAKLQEDKKAENAIKKAIKEVNQKIVKSMKDEEKKGVEDDKDKKDPEDIRDAIRESNEKNEQEDIRDAIKESNEKNEQEDIRDAIKASNEEHEQEQEAKEDEPKDAVDIRDMIRASNAEHAEDGEEKQ